MIVLSAAVGLAACTQPDAASVRADADVAMEGVVIDSIHPMPVMIERFQQQAGEPVEALPETSAPSRDSLVMRFVQAVADSSVEDVQALRVDARTFAYLVAPTSSMSAAPYNQPPELAWTLIDQNSRKGESRVVRAFGGGPLEYSGYTCAESVREGENTLWTGCTVEVAGRGPMRLFGPILERGGRFMFLSIGNDL